MTTIGILLKIAYRGLNTVSHGGGLAGYRAQLIRFPEQNFSVIILANRGDANPTHKAFQIADILLKDNFINNLDPKVTVIQTDDETLYKRKEKIDFSRLNLADYSGHFYSEELDATYLLSLEDGILKLQIANYDSQELNICDIDIFTSEVGLVRFSRSRGVINGFELDAGRVTNLKFKKK